jgi:hypothetical protein
MTQAFNLALLANKVNSSGQLNADTGLYNSPIPSGSVFLLYQASAPTGWTQVTTLNDYALRIVSSTGGSTGGTTAFSTVFANQTPTISGFTVGATTLSSSQIPSHTHDYWTDNAGGVHDAWALGSNPTANSPANMLGYTGGGGSHTHSSGSATSSAIVLNVRYANIILCSKN